MTDYIKEAAQLRATAAQCRDLAQTATDADAAKSLRSIASEIEALLTIHEDDRARLKGMSPGSLSRGDGRSDVLPAPRD